MTLAEPCAELARRQRWLKDLPLAANSPPSESGYVFRHALYREVLYKRVGRLARVELHRKVAAALERERAQGLNVGAAELASHLDLAREPMRGVGLLRGGRRIGAAALLAGADAEPHRTRHGAAAAGRAERRVRGARDDARHLARHRSDAGEGLQLARRQARRSSEPCRCSTTCRSTRCAGWSCRSWASRTRCAASWSRRSAIARRSEALWKANADRTALVCACLVHGLLERDRGRPSVAREWLEKGIRAVRRARCEHVAGGIRCRPRRDDAGAARHRAAAARPRRARTPADRGRVRTGSRAAGAGASPGRVLARRPCSRCGMGNPERVPTRPSAWRECRRNTRARGQGGGALVSRLGRGASRRSPRRPSPHSRGLRAACAAA